MRFTDWVNSNENDYTLYRHETQVNSLPTDASVSVQSCWEVILRVCFRKEKALLSNFTMLYHGGGIYPLDIQWHRDPTDIIQLISTGIESTAA